MNMYIENRTNRIEFQGHGSKVKVIFSLVITVLHSGNCMDECIYIKYTPAVVSKTDTLLNYIHIMPYKLQISESLHIFILFEQF